MIHKTMEMHEMEIRRIEPRYFTDLQLLQRESDVRVYSRDMWLFIASKLRPAVCHACISDGKIVGFVIGIRLPGGENIRREFLDNDRCMWTIFDLVIHPEYRLKGLGSRLLWLVAGAVGSLPGAPHLVIHCAENNPAFKFYMKMGAYMVGRIPGYYDCVEPKDKPEEIRAGVEDLLSPEERAAPLEPTMTNIKPLGDALILVMYPDKLVELYQWILFLSESRAA